MIQTICGIMMLVCITSIIFYFVVLRNIIGEDTCYVFVAESAALVSFGVSWLTEGIDLQREIANFLPEKREASVKWL